MPGRRKLRGRSVRRQRRLCLPARHHRLQPDELQRLSSASYGPGGTDWDGQALAKAIRSFAVLEDEAGSRDEVLPPLMPGN